MVESWSLELRTYQDRVGIDYYNLDFTNTKQVLEFLKNCLLIIKYPEDSDLQGWIGLERDMKMLSRELDFSFNVLVGEQERYKVIVDKILNKEDLLEEELSYVESRLYVPRRLIQRDRKLYYTVGPSKVLDAMPVVMAAYQWVVNLSQGELDVKRCSLTKCKNIFIASGPGKPQKYCRPSHRVRAHQLRQEEKAALSA